MYEVFSYVYVVCTRKEYLNVGPNGDFRIPWLSFCLHYYNLDLKSDNESFDSRDSYIHYLNWVTYLVLLRGQIKQGKNKRGTQLSEIYFIRALVVRVH